MERKITRRDESPRLRRSFGTPTRRSRAPQSTLRSLNHQVNNSQISLTIEARSAAVVGGGGFTIGKAAHDAGRVLTVAAAAALIALAVLAPLALVAALAWWIAVAVRRHRREQALDLA
jgi:fatty acid desaturase